MSSRKHEITRDGISAYGLTKSAAQHEWTRLRDNYARRMALIPPWVLVYDGATIVLVPSIGDDSWCSGVRVREDGLLRLNHFFTATTVSEAIGIAVMTLAQRLWTVDHDDEGLFDGIARCAEVQASTQRDKFLRITSLWREALTKQD